MKVLIACLFPVFCILFALLVDSNIVFGLIAIVILLAYAIVKKINANKIAKAKRKELFEKGNKE